MGKATVIKYKIGDDPPHILDEDAITRQETAPQDLRHISKTTQKQTCKSSVNGNGNKVDAKNSKKVCFSISILKLH